MRDLMNQIHPVIACAPQIVADGSTLKSGALPVAGYESNTFIIMTGDLSDADADWTAIVKEGDSDDQTQHTPVADAHLIGTEALCAFDYSDDNSAFKIGYKGGCTHISIEIVNGTENSGNAPLAVLLLQGDPHDCPTPNPPGS